MTDRDLVVANLDACWTSLMGLLGSLGDDQWGVPSLCPEWTIHGVAAHLVSVEQVLSGWMPEGLDTPPPFGEVASRFEAAMAMAPADLVEVMTATFDTRRRQLGVATDDDFSTPSVTPVGPGTYGRFMAVRVFDAWMHERDCRAPLGLDTDNGGPAAEMSLDEVQGSIGYIAGKRIGLTDGQSLHFEIRGAMDRDIYVAVDGRAAEVDFLDAPTATLHCDAMAFMNQACGRIDPEKAIEAGDIRWSGDQALGAHAARNLRFTM